MMRYMKLLSVELVELVVHDELQKLKLVLLSLRVELVELVEYDELQTLEPMTKLIQLSLELRWNCCCRDWFRCCMCLIVA